ncbi:MAG: hypothetical protein HQM12_07270, partial [SAR324 cluster bacterium]|nr:hypothetical protein [SAR324 cluster bacterium]
TAMAIAKSIGNDKIIEILSSVPEAEQPEPELEAAASSPSAYPEEEESSWVGNVRVVFGTKTLNNEYAISGLKALDSQQELGFQLDFGQKTWPVRVALEYLTASAGVSATFLTMEQRIFLTTNEINLGVHKVFDTFTNMHMYVGGGASMAEGKLEVSGDQVIDMNNASGTGTGYWLDGGAYWIIGSDRAFNLGLQFKLSSATAAIGSDAETAVGGIHFLITTGWLF